MTDAENFLLGSFIKLKLWCAAFMYLCCLIKKKTVHTPWLINFLCGGLKY